MCKQGDEDLEDRRAAGYASLEPIRTPASGMNLPGRKREGFQIIPAFPIKLFIVKPMKKPCESIPSML